MLTRLRNIAEDTGKSLEQLAQMTDRELKRERVPRLGPVTLGLLRELYGPLARKPSPGERTIVQIAAAATAKEREALYALCDDGTVWKIFTSFTGARKWRWLPKIPQGPALDADEL